MCRFRPSEKVEPPLPHATSAIGIDVGIARFATFSDGRFLEPLNSFNRHEAKLSRAQRAMSRKHWLADAHSQVLQQALKDLERAYANFFAKRSAAPRFKKKGQHDSFRFPQGVKLDHANSRLFFAEARPWRCSLSAALRHPVSNWHKLA
jgi:transposase